MRPESTVVELGDDDGGDDGGNTMIDLLDRIDLVDGTIDLADGIEFEW